MAHRGEIIEKFIRKHDISLTGLAKRTPFTTRTMYRHFQNSSLELEKILEYSQALNHDFSDEIPEMELFKFHLNEPPAPWQKQPGSNQSEADFYRNKYEQLLEKFSSMQEQYIKLLQQKEQTIN